MNMKKLSNAHAKMLVVGAQVRVSGLSGWQDVSHVADNHIVIGQKPVMLVRMEDIDLVRSKKVVEFIKEISATRNPRQILDSIEDWLGWCNEDMCEGLKSSDDAISLYWYWQANNRKLPEFACDTDDYDEYLSATHRFLALGYDPMGEYQGERIQLEGVPPIIIQGSHFQEAIDDPEFGCVIENGVSLFTKEAVIEKQKGWNDTDRYKSFDFGGSDFWLIVSIGKHELILQVHGVQNVPDIESLVESAAIHFTYFR